MRSKSIIFGAAALTLAVQAPALADDVADFYKGKQVSLTHTGGPAGGFALYTRILSKHMTKHIPGNPKSVAKQYTGAGGVRVLNAIYNVFPQDGTAIVAAGRSVIAQPLFRNASKAKYDGSKLKWLGSANQEYSLCVFHKSSKYKSTSIT